LTDKTSGGQPHVLTGILFICGGLSIGWSQRKPA
jgi:hypothetical protein